MDAQQPSFQMRWRARLDDWQRASTPVSFSYAVVKKFADDRAGRLAALIAYYAFFSLFPVLLVAVTIVAFVVSDSTAAELENSALAQIPVVGDRIGQQVDQLGGSWIALVVGLATALWAGLGCMQAAQDAMNNVWGVPRLREPSFLLKRLRSVAVLGVVGLSLAIGATGSQLVALVPDVSGAGRVAGAALSMVANVGAFLLAYQILGVDRHPWRQLLPGAIVAGVGYTALQFIGQWYVQYTIAGAEDTYGTFAVVIGLLGWLYLLAQLILFAAEINVVHAHRLWPRSLRLEAPTAADEEIIRIAARSAQLRPGTQILVDFGGPEGHHRIEPADPLGAAP
ncbi:MAG TPA: YihY/virulence factor BrkB family protein [Acidimicrobiales bacterium]|nr:YihY/virulence factor BrkB family protein [Acidimicrobiales bacterium]